jgi:hypothetical protein
LKLSQCGSCPIEAFIIGRVFVGYFVCVALKEIQRVGIYLEIFVWIGVLGKQLLTCLNRD